MSSRRAGALLVASGLVVAISCGSDDGDRAPPAVDQSEAGAPDQAAGNGAGAAPPHGGDGASAGGGGAPGAGGNSTPSAGGDQGGESAMIVGGEGGAGGRGESGAGGMGGQGGADVDPPLFEDDFDGEALQEDGGLSSSNYVEFSRWDVSSGSVDVTKLPNGLIESPGGYGPGQPARGVVVDLNGSTQQDGTLQTKTQLTFSPNVTYTLRYVLGNARNQTNAVTVSVAGVFSETRTQSSFTAFTAYEATFTPVLPVSAKIVFESAGGGDNDGLLLDSVSVRASP